MSKQKLLHPSSGLQDRFLQDKCLNIRQELDIPLISLASDLTNFKDTVFRTPHGISLGKLKRIK
ncbi:hypothetical protein NC652_035697 [Populus alba x Populus x berolinensis]|nr:hypothetical protein NC652_035697 [Populus alba x Populus x berolinensis]